MNAFFLQEILSLRHDVSHAEQQLRLLTTPSYSKDESNKEFQAFQQNVSSTHSLVS
jgi:hypothetical protein